MRSPQNTLSAALPTVWLAALLVSTLLPLAACSPFAGGAFQCQESSQCNPDGVCQPNGFCSFGAADCASGQRYGEYAGDDLSGVCVGEEPAPDPDPDAGPVPDARPDPDGPPPESFCDPADSTLVACYRFEDSLDDESGNGHTPGPDDETFEAGRDGLAVRTGAGTRLDIADSADFNVAQLTFEAWIRPAALPGGNDRAGIYDVNLQYGVFLYPPDDLHCIMVMGNGSGFTAVAAGAVAVDTWTHVACTYDGDRLVVYVDGVPVTMRTGGGPLGTNLGNAVALAGNAPSNDPYIGLIDSLRLWNVVRSPDQICAAAGCPAQ